MRNALHRPFPIVSVMTGIVALLGLCYLSLIAVVMSYAVVAVDFSQSVRDDKAAVATLESNYLGAVSNILNTDYRKAGYQKPVAEIFVPERAVTALR